MITTDDVAHLADLARIEISREEIQGLTKEIDDILGYVGQIKNVAGDVEVSDRTVPPLRNVMRDDVVEHRAGEYTEAILSNAPAREGNFVKVKKIL